MEEWAQIRGERFPENLVRRSSRILSKSGGSRKVLNVAVTTSKYLCLVTEPCLTWRDRAYARQPAHRITYNSLSLPSRDPRIKPLVFPLHNILLPLIPSRSTSECTCIHRGRGELGCVDLPERWSPRLSAISTREHFG